jgi:flagellar hook-associated protein 1 FlgK
MADLLAILNNSARSLQAHQAATATAAHNLQNANTPGYARQRAELQATLPAEMGIRGQIGRGVSLLEVSQARDKFVERQMPGAISSQARSSATAHALETMNALDPDAVGGLTSALGEFFAAARAASQNPSEPGLRTALVAAGRTLGFAFNRTAGSIDAARDGIDAEMTGLVAEVNAAASAVARLNKEIKAARASGGEPNDLLDVRQKELDKLAELTGAQAVANATGDITVMIPGGGTLVSGGRSATLGTIANPANGGHLSLTFNATDGSPPVTLPNNMLSGRMGGLLEARDVVLGGAETRVDQLAVDLAGAVNTVHRAGFGLDGSTNRDFFATSGTATGAATAFAVDPAIIADPLRIAAAASAATTPGDATNLQALIATESQALSSGVDAGKTFGQIVTDYGAAAANAGAMAQQDGTILSHLQDVRESVSGVSIDEELVNLTKAQRAFEAVMKVLTTADEMLATLMSLRQ